MKKEYKTIDGQEILFIIGRCQSENHKVIDMGSPDDIWFHASETPSCHVVAIIPDDYESDIKYVIKMGAVLCKQYTNKLKSMSNVEIVYTCIKNVEKLKEPGSVNILGGGKYIQI